MHKTPISLLLSMMVLLLAESCSSTIENIPPPSVERVMKPYTVSTLAGSGTYGFADGAGKDAAFSDAYGLTTDAAGNVYVADGNNNRIRKITPHGLVTTVAGDSIFGTNDGPVSEALFSYPHGLVVDGDGNIFVADTGNNLIRKISREGIVSTIAGSGAAGFKDGAGRAAQFNFPADLVLDGKGNLYVSDGANQCIRKVIPGGTVSTFATGFGFPEGIEIDKAGNLYVADAGGFVIRKVTPEGAVSVLAGSTSETGYIDGNGGEARFHNPEGIAIDKDGNLYVGDLNSAIRKVTPAGIVSTIAGSGTAGFADGAAADARFNQPSGIAIDAGGNIYISDITNSRIRKIYR